MSVSKTLLCIFLFIVGLLLLSSYGWLYYRTNLVRCSLSDAKFREEIKNEVLREYEKRHPIIPAESVATKSATITPTKKVTPSPTVTPFVRITVAPTK